MTRVMANSRHEAARRRAHKMEMRISRMTREIEILLSLKVRPSDNDPAAIERAKKIATKYLTA